MLDPYLRSHSLKTLMHLQLEGKTALVTGSTAGIGLAIATGLAGEGATVIVNGRTKDRVVDAEKKIRAKRPKAKIEIFAGDLGKANETEKVFQRFPTIDILVNNLGIYEPKPFEKITDGDWLTIIETNFLSGVRLSRAYLSGMKSRDWGRIIFISSESAVQTPVEMIHYGVTKSMQVALARGLAQLTSGTKVTVNSLLVGPTKSEGVDAFVKDMAKQQGKTDTDVEKAFFQTVRPSSLLKRFETPEEVANMAVYIASPLSSGTNGAALRVDGGVIQAML
jgi:NAD(P)-dependent dehydrogenase (short-subunit alcohol dehydrogenase family)